MGNSRYIIESLLADMETYVNDPLVIFEGYRLDTSSLEVRQDVPKARVALYEQNEDVTTAVGAYKPADSDQNYSIDISVVKAYRNDKAHNAEYVVYDIKDALIEWSKGLDAGAVTLSYIVSFGYEGSSRMIRDNRFVTQTLNFTAKKNLLVNQTPIYLTDNTGNILTDSLNFLTT